MQQREQSNVVFGTTGAWVVAHRHRWQRSDVQPLARMVRSLITCPLLTLGLLEMSLNYHRT